MHSGHRFYYSQPLELTPFIEGFAFHDVGKVQSLIIFILILVMEIKIGF